MDQSWRYSKLGEVCEIIMGQSPPSATYNFDSVGIPFFQGKAEFTELYPLVEKWCSAPNKIAEANDILLSVRAPVGATNIANQKCCIGRGLAAIRFENYKYLFYFLRSIEQQLDKKGTGTTFRAISGETIRETVFPLPPRETQQSIVSKIEELFSELDKSIENLRTAQQQLKTYRQAVLKWAFEGKLTVEWRKQHGAGVQLPPGAPAERSRVRDPSSPQEGNGDLPEGWVWVKSGDVIDTINNGYTPTKEYLSEGSGEIPFIKVYNLNFDGTLNFKKNPTFIPEAIHKKDLKRSICFPGDVLINIVGPPLGKASVVSTQYPEWNINQAIVLFRPNEKILPKYIAYFLRNPVTINWLENTSKATAGQWNVKVSTCRKIPLPYCSVEEQYQIIQEIESRLSVTEKLEETITQSLQQAEALRQSILKKAFEGRLVAEKKQPVYKPKNDYFYQMQILALIAKASRQKNIKHGEMTIAKYAYLADKIYNIPTHYSFKRWHLGPYPPEIKKAINNKKFFKTVNGHIQLADEKLLLKYNNPYKEQVETAVADLAVIFSKYNANDRPRKTELLATVCKVVEDIKTIDFAAVRKSMKEWKIQLKNTPVTTKAAKFTEEETKKCLAFIVEKGWDEKLIGS